MRIILATIAALGLFMALPTGSRIMAPETVPAPERVTVIHKNLSSPTLEELGRKAGDPSHADAPEQVPLFGPRKAQWI
jgi:hypothetical protein